MSFDIVLSVGDEYDYQLLGGEELYKLLPTFNEKFLLNLTEENFPNTKAQRRESDGLVSILAVSNDGCAIYNFTNTTNKGIEILETAPIVKNDLNIITAKPVNFKEELDFLSNVITNIAIEYNLENSKVIIMLQQILNNYEYGNWNIIGENKNNVSDFILRYYGSGDKVPQEYGIYDEKISVAIIDLKKDGVYETYCLRTRKYHVYDNGYRSWN